jgi:hypothetical protein
MLRKRVMYAVQALADAPNDSERQTSIRDHPKAIDQSTNSKVEQVSEHSQEQPRKDRTSVLPNSMVCDPTPFKR